MEKKINSISDLKKIPLFTKTDPVKKEHPKPMVKEDVRANPKVEEDAHTKQEHSSTLSLLEHTLTGEMFHALFTLCLSPHLAVKAFLVVFIAVSYALTSYTIIELVLSYLDYGVTTTVRTIFETPATFPKVTICNVNQFTTSYAYDLVHSVSLEYGFDVFDNMLLKNSTRYNKGLQASSLSNALLRRIKSLSDADKKRLSHQLHDSLLICSFNYQQCTADDFAW